MSAAPSPTKTCELPRLNAQTSAPVSVIAFDDALSDPLAVVWSSVKLSVVAARNVPIESAAAPERWIEPAASDAGPPANVQFVIASPAGPEL